LTAAFSIRFTAIIRHRQVELLSPADVTFLDFETDVANRLRCVERKDHRLLTCLISDPPSSARAAVIIERMIDRVISFLGTDEDGCR